MTTPTAEFSRFVTADRIPPTGIEQDFEARPTERAALAKRFDLVELKKLTARLELSPGHEQEIKVKGRMKADVVQSCVVTLEPVVSHLTVDIDMVFVAAGQHPTGAGSPNPDGPDEEFEIYSGGRIDLGEMLAQHLGINLDPYPRKPHAALAATEFGADVPKTQPFAQLAALPKKPEK